MCIRHKAYIYKTWIVFINRCCIRVHLSLGANVNGCALAADRGGLPSHCYILMFILYPLSCAINVHTCTMYDLLNRSGFDVNHGFSLHS